MMAMLVPLDGCSKVEKLGKMQKDASKAGKMDTNETDELLKKIPEGFYGPDGVNSSVNNGRTEEANIELPSISAGDSTPDENRELDKGVQAILDEFFEDELPSQKKAVEHLEAGLKQNAINTAEACLKKENPEEGEFKKPVLLAVLALGYHGLNIDTEAEKYRSQMLDSMKLPEYKDDPECQSFLQKVNKAFGIQESEDESAKK